MNRDFSSEFISSLLEKESDDVICRGWRTDFVLIDNNLAVKIGSNLDIDVAEENRAIAQENGIRHTNTLNRKYDLSEYGFDEDSLVAYQPVREPAEYSSDHLRQIADIIEQAGENGIALDAKMENFGYWSFRDQDIVEYIDLNDTYSVIDMDDEPCEAAYEHMKDRFPTTPDYRASNEVEKLLEDKTSP